MDDRRHHPTMIIPSGTEISVNDGGQLSIRTPGNLVIQNSGVYSTIASEAGSVRIDPGVTVEAVTVEAAESCFIAGSLTAWRVKSPSISIEKDARAYILLQEAEQVSVDRSARMVGNFSSEKELYLMLGRFNRQLRQMWERIGPGDGAPAIHAGGAAAPRSEEPFPIPSGTDRPAGEPRPATGDPREGRLDEVVRLLESELRDGRLDGPSREGLERLVAMIRERRLEEVESRYPYLLSQVARPSEALRTARTALQRLFA